MTKREIQRKTESKLVEQFLAEYNKTDDFGIYTHESKQRLVELEEEAMYLYVENEISSRFYNLVFKPKAKANAKFSDQNPYYYNYENIRNAQILNKKFNERGWQTSFFMLLYNQKKRKEVNKMTLEERKNEIRRKINECQKELDKLERTMKDLRLGYIVTVTESEEVISF